MHTANKLDIIEDDDETDMRKQSDANNFSLASSTQLEKNVGGEAAGMMDSYRVDTSFTRGAEKSEVWKIDDNKEDSNEMSPALQIERSES